MKLWDSVGNVRKRLDDYPAVGSEGVWTHDEIELYLQDGYNAFCRQSKCIFDMFYPENVAPAGNYVGAWEREYMTSGMVAVGQLNFTGGYWERDYAEASDVGPVRNCFPWEDTYLASMDDADVFSCFYPVPEDNVSVARVTYNNKKLSAEWTHWFEQNDRSYQTVQGTPSYFAMDREGISTIRVVPAGNGAASEPDVDGSFGLLRSAGDTDHLGTWSPTGTWGVLREIPEHFVIGGQYGIPRRLFSDVANIRAEYFRLGQDLTEYPYELPGLFVKYVEFYACAKALERDGPGQDMKLSQHYFARFSDGVSRMVRRLTETKRPITGKVGSVGRIPTAPALARLPWRYGRQIRRGY